MANFGVPPVTARDSLVAKGITINGLAILSEEPWLDEYYRSNVVGGPAAFVAVAKNFDSFAEAMPRSWLRGESGAATEWKRRLPNPARCISASIRSLE